MIHVCFAIYDPARHYSKFTGTAMVSLFENTDSQITVHLLHDNTLTQDNRDKFIQIAERYEQQLKFYNVEDLCTDRFEQISVYFPDIYADRHSIATFYRFFILNLFPQEIEKVVYLDSDIIIKFDILEFWQIELGDKPLGAVSEFYQVKDRDASIGRLKKYITICGEGVVNPEDYFNAGIMLLNLKVLREKEVTILAGMKFISEHPQFKYLDQDILNYCFSTTYLKLPLKFNRFVLHAKREDELTIEEKIYHYATSRICFVMDSRDLYTQLFMDYFIKTPWVDDDTARVLSGDSLPSRKNYAVSVVIPMYNAAEFVGECLESLLIQTFQDYEVIVVDDCSTDNSAAIVESYAPRFDGRLKLTKTEKNSGGGGNVPRNIGIMLARGEYIQFLDADDMLLGTALDSLYKAAILYDAEVVYTASWYRLNAPNDISLTRDVMSRKLSNIRTELTVDDPNKNLSRLLLEPGEGNFRACWSKFVRRDFLAKNKILFPNLSNAGDFIGVINIYCHARRFLRITTPLYFYRVYHGHSIWRTVRESREQCWYWFSSFVDFAKALYEMEKENEILSENPIYCLAALKGHFPGCLSQTKEARKELDSEEFFKVLHSEFAKISDDSAAILPFLFNLIDSEKKDTDKKVNDHYLKKISKFKNFLTGRIDIKLATKAGDFQIVSVSDDKARIDKPAWFQKGGIGYVIQSLNGELTFIAKATANGLITLILKGVDVRNPQDNAKRIPYWIDYAKLTVNDEPILDKVTPTWHDEPYRYTMNVKAGEEIKINVEWLPHRADTIEIAPPPPVKVESSIPDSFKPFITARIDTKLLTKAGDFQIVSVSDDKATLKKPKWLQKGGVGYQLESYAGQLDFIAKTTADGQIQLRLRGLDVRDPENNAKRIPHWIDYTKLTINDKPIFDTLTPAWLNDSYTYTIDTKAHEEIKIHIEWFPHRSDT